MTSSSSHSSRRWRGGASLGTGKENAKRCLADRITAYLDSTMALSEAADTASHFSRRGGGPDGRRKAYQTLGDLGIAARMAERALVEALRTSRAQLTERDIEAVVASLDKRETPESVMAIVRTTFRSVDATPTWMP